MENKYNKYQDSKIYKIICNITDEIYIGSTYNTLEERLSIHKCNKDCSSKQIINRGDYEIILIKDYPCESDEELRIEEQKYINNNICVNQRRAYQSEEDKKQDEKKWQKKHYINNKDNRLEYQREYYKINQGKKIIQTQQYYQSNKDKINQARNKKIECKICGVLICKRNIKRHQKSKKCKK